MPALLAGPPNFVVEYRAMALSHSNVHTPLVLQVALMAAYRDGKNPTLSITAPGFPDPSLTTEFSGQDQQLVDLEAVVLEYVQSSETLSGEKLTVAAFFDRMAGLLRAKSIEHERDGDV